MVVIVVEETAGIVVWLLHLEGLMMRVRPDC